MSTVQYENITAQSPVMFISDLHLDPAHTKTIDLAIKYLASARNARALFIVGDLFEYWLGDDACDPRLLNIVDALIAVTAAGCDVHLMHGNRDFLMGEQFAQTIGAQLHREDHIKLALNDLTISLMHGDTLCTDDIDYLKLRAMVRNPHWQQQFLALSIEERIAQAQALRDKSRDAVAAKSTGIMDVNAHAVAQHCAEHSSDCLMHGHTHRPADYDGNVEINTRRIVLGDWKPNHAMVARFDGLQLALEEFT